ncbi:hypothetical protein F4677DRAFT_120549 [Hypoxylon crocopeplum]|nr:hypothetical protein F4677DRAFT_120549 [Hypoxylon crocopeplum]
MMSADAASSSTPGTYASPSQAQLQPYSCLQCKNRKVKCDRIDPCANCCKAGAKCIYRAPPPRRRRKRVQPEASIEGVSAIGSENHDIGSLLEKVRRYEKLLKDLGMLKRATAGTIDEREINIALRSRPAHTGDLPTGSTDPMAGGDGKLIAKYGKSRYLENNLWMSVTDEFQDPEEILEELSEDENKNVDDSGSEATTESNLRTLCSVTQDPVHFIFPIKRVDDDLILRSLHPQPMQIFTLWQAFVDNVNPLIKILHVPTTQKAILDATADLDHVPKAMEALLFGIYVVAVSSMEEAECQSILQETKASALNRFRMGAQQALRAAGILKTSDMMVLQAYVLYLSAARHYDAHSFWSLTGISIRIGQRIGLHKDGEGLKLPPFETEMRRRLWINMVQLDSRAAELSGTGLSIVAQLWNTKPPLNINDCDLYPDMREPPVEQVTATEMMFLLLRAQVGMFLKKEMPENDAFDGGWSRLSNPAISMIEKDRAINELEQTLEEKFIRHCDLQIPLHCISSLIAKSAICRMRLFAHLPWNARGPPPNSTSTEAEEDLLFTNSLQILQSDTQIRTDKSLRRFLWHVNMHFQWHALIYLLTYLRTHTSADTRTNIAWTTIDEVFANHPEIIHGGRMRSKLCIGVDNLTLKAWEARESELQRSSTIAPSSRVPSCVRQLREQRIGAIATSSWAASGESSFEMPLDSVSQAAQDQIGQKLDLNELQNDNADGFDLNFASGDERNNPSSATNTTNEIEMVGIDAGLIDWEQWDSMCQEFEMQDQWNDAFTPAEAFPEL